MLANLFRVRTIAGAEAAADPGEPLPRAPMLAHLDQVLARTAAPQHL